MSGTIVQQKPASHKAPILPRIGGEYEIGGDQAPWCQGRLQRAVLVLEDGAWAGQVAYDALGEHIRLAFDADDQRIPAADGWEQAIIRALGSPAFPSPEGDADPFGVAGLDDLAALFTSHSCACGARISAEASACFDCAPEQYESDRQFDCAPAWAERRAA